MLPSRNGSAVVLLHLPLLLIDALFAAIGDGQTLDDFNGPLALEWRSVVRSVIQRQTQLDAAPFDARRQKVPKSERKVLEADLSVTIVVQVSENDVCVGRIDVESVAKLPKVMGVDQARSFLVATTKQGL